VFFSVKNKDKRQGTLVAAELERQGFTLFATRGTAHALRTRGIRVETVNKVNQGSPHVLDAIHSGTIAIVVNTTLGAKAVHDSYALRRQTLLANIPYFTTIAAALAACDALEAAQGEPPVRVKSLQEWASAELPSR